MADYSITAASVLPITDDTQTVRGTLGATVTAGQWVYQNTTDRLYYLADADALATSIVSGLTLSGGAAGQPVTIATAGNVTTNAVGTAGAVVLLSTTSGGWAPVADLASGDYITIVGGFTTTTNFLISITPLRVAEP